MSHQTFKVSIVIDEIVENFYIKHYVDEFQPIFNKFKNLVFQRNPSVNVPILRIYWIDAENDAIMISCEEDFRLYIEQGRGKKVFFSVISQQPRADDDDEIAMEAEESNDRPKLDRKSRKSTRDEEKQKRAAKRLTEKMRNAEEKVRSEEERRARYPEKYERKNAERLERAKKRCEQIRQIIGSMDPANLNTASQETSFNVGASTSAEQTSADPSLAVLHPSPETIRLLSTAIAGCLQPCSLINKILNEIIAFVPQPAAEATSQASAQTSSDQQQQTEIPRQTTATNTSDLNTPTTGHPSNQEIEALFKEAAKELEKMNEIVNNSKAMDGSTNSLASSMTGITQVERVFQNITDSAISNATIINSGPPEYEDQIDNVATRGTSPQVEDDYKIVTPPKSMRSRESSIEVHDVNSMMSDDSRDWTMLDAVGNDDEGDNSIKAQEEVSIPSSPRIVNPESGAVPKESSNPFRVEPMITSVSTETQTPTSLASIASAASSQEEMNASIRQSIATVGQMNDIVKNSIASAQESLKSIPKTRVVQIQTVEPEAPRPSAPAPVQPILRLPQINLQRIDHFIPHVIAPVASAPPPAMPAQASPMPAVRQAPSQPSNIPSTSTTANVNATRTSEAPKWKPSAMGPAVIVYDPNPKINAAVHTMINMGFSNEGGWLTQLLVNVDGDVPQAINFLTPQPKNKKP